MPCWTTLVGKNDSSPKSKEVVVVAANVDVGLVVVVVDLVDVSVESKKFKSHSVIVFLGCPHNSHLAFRSSDCFVS